MKPLTISLVLAFSLGTAGCALTSKAELVETRYFSPEHAKPSVTSASPASSAPKQALELRLGRITSGPSLRERIAYRDAAYELGYYDDLRWTERPETFVRRALGTALFEEHGLHRALGGMAPVLDVELIAFDDLRLSTGRAVRIQLKLLLHDEAGVLLEDTLTVERPVAGEKPKIEEVIAAMAIALDATSEDVTARVEKALAARRAASPDVAAK
jgi:ABC-type uncharacterized transport system auxiliary subunit